MAFDAEAGPPEERLRIIVPSVEEGKRLSTGAPTRQGSMEERSSAPKNRYSAVESIILSRIVPHVVHVIVSSWSRSCIQVLHSLQ